MKNIRFHFDNVHFDKPLEFLPYRVMQTGDLVSDADFSCEEHVQRVHELTYIVDGEAVFVMNNERKTARAGDVIFDPKNSLHAIECSKINSIHYYYIGFEIADKSRATERKLSEFFDSVTPFCVQADKSLRHSFHDLFSNILSRDSFSDDLCADAVRRLLVSAVRSFRGDDEWYYLTGSCNGKYSLISAICARIDDSVDNIDALKMLSSEFGYSYSYLSSLFSSTMNVSLREYFMRRRYERACELLDGGMSVTEISEQMGYSSVHAFSHAFTARMGVPPSKYRKDK